MRKKLTARTIETLSAPTQSRIDVWDDLLPGFGVRLSPTGRKTWFAMGRIGGRLVRHTIGTYPILGLAEAREAARIALGHMQLGLAPNGSPHEAVVSVDPAPAVRTLGDTIPEFIEKYAKPKNRSWKDSERALNRFTELMQRPLAEIRRAEVVAFLDRIVAERTPIVANRALAAIRKLFAWALDRGLVEVHPVRGMKLPAKEVSRERVLSDAEISAFWQATGDLGPICGGMYRMLLVTGQRRGEVSSMRWSQIDMDRAIWTIPAEIAKNGKAHAVPLTELAMEILTNVPRFLHSDFVFTTTGTSPLSGFNRAQKRLEQAMGVDDWRIHDLRRTCASGLARLGVAPHVIEKVLNPISGQISGVAAVYNRHGYDAEKRGALERWERHLISVNSAKTPPMAPRTNSRRSGKRSSLMPNAIGG
jgi:integrase